MHTAVDLLETLNAPAYKIASFEVLDLPLIRYVASTGKPMIISTGMADAQEIQEAIDAAREGGCKELAVLHCVSGYPAPAEDYNLRTIPDMIERFGLVTGLSDHTLDNTTAIASVIMGASIIEKHFTLDKTLEGPDHEASLDPSELKAMIDQIRLTTIALGEEVKECQPIEVSNKAAVRRSLVAKQPIAAGAVITEADLECRRPGAGRTSFDFYEVIGSVATQDYAVGEYVGQ